MAPRPIEPFAHFVERLRKADAGKRPFVVRFGAPHHTHAVVREGDVYRVRALYLDPAKADAYLREHGTFMPEHAEMLAEPGPKVVLEARSVDALCEVLGRRWPAI
ncbi:MAG: hypothetical protein R3B09_20625 [Nannocystaceae bacterium]